MLHQNDNQIPSDFINYGSNENEHFLDPEKLPSEGSFTLRNTVLEEEVTKRFKKDLPKHKAIWKAEENKLREENIEVNQFNSVELDRWMQLWSRSPHNPFSNNSCEG